MAPMPDNLPFRLVSETIGQGAYAFIRKATPLTKPTPVVAIKFINKEHASKRGQLTNQQLRMEITLHKHLGRHQNIIELISYGDSPAWVWIAMELADSGDLFDKIEADVGVGEDVAHFYFFQLISAVAYMHDRGVAHRDLKPENILLSASGDLKVADFGLATLFHLRGNFRPSVTVCGSPPYIAPEILKLGQSKSKEEMSYDPSVADIWSCGVILFVLLVGNTPWDEPSTETSQEFYDYVRSDGRPDDDELWNRVPGRVASLLRKLLAVDPSNRMTLEDIRRHSWFTRSNPHIDVHGRVRDPVALASQMLQSLRINFSTPVRPNMYAARPSGEHRKAFVGADSAYADDEFDITLLGPQFSLTQPEPQQGAFSTIPMVPPAAIAGLTAISASQPITNAPSSLLSSAPSNIKPDKKSTLTATSFPSASQPIDQLLTSIPALSQFSQSTKEGYTTITLTQQARRFNDLVPANSLTHFFSIRSPALVVSTLGTALHTLGVPVSTDYLAAQFRQDTSIPNEKPVLKSVQDLRNPHIGSNSSSKSSKQNPIVPILPFVIPVRATAGRRLQPLRGSIVVAEQHGEEEELVKMVMAESTNNGNSRTGNVAGNPSAGLLQVRFIKSKGDPVEWRRLFKRVVILCKDVVWMPEE